MDKLSVLFHPSGRKIGLFFPDVVVSEIHTDTLEITEHQVESGATIADHAYKKLTQVVMEVGFAGGGALFDFASASTATGLLGRSPKDMYQQLLDLQASCVPLNVVTGKRVYDNMLLQNIEVTTKVSTENVLSAKLTLREVHITHIPALAADKNEMTQGVSTSAIQNTGNKTAFPVDKYAMTSLFAVGAAIVGASR